MTSETAWTPPTSLTAALVLALPILLALLPIFHRLLLSPLRSLPGPTLYAVTPWRLAWDGWRGSSTRAIHALHAQHRRGGETHDGASSAVCIGPAHISFASPAALAAIYGAGSRAERTPFYALFEPYGVPTMFTTRAGAAHAARKRLLARVYAKSAILGREVTGLVGERVRWFLEAVGAETGREGGSGPVEVGKLLHFFTLDVSSAFIYGPEIGTRALRAAEGEEHRGLLDDFAHPLRRRLSWAAVHGVPGFVVDAVLWFYGLGHRPRPFSRLRAYGKEAFAQFPRSRPEARSRDGPPPTSLIAQLWTQRTSSSSSPPLTDLQIASECVDHLLAGVETTRNTLLMLLWSLSRPEHAPHQARLRRELQSASGTDLPYLQAVVKEAQRLYVPLPALQPRRFGADMVIDGVFVPAGTTVSMAPYTLHRDEVAFPDPLAFQPERWMDRGDEAEGEKDDRRPSRMFWAFSSGARMCTGAHLATAEMEAVVAAIYRTYRTTLPPGDSGETSPTITSRFETFWDELCERHTDDDQCWLEFHPLSPG